MSFEEKADAFLAGGNTDTKQSEDKYDEFLAGGEIEKPKATDPEPEQELKDGDKSIWESTGDYAAGANDAIIRTLGLPADAANWALEKMGSDKRVYGGSKDVSKGMATIGAGYEKGKEPDTGSYKAGNYTGTGLLFLAPWLKVGKAAATSGAYYLPKIADKTKLSLHTGAVQPHVGTTRGIAQRITAPFVTDPKRAYLAELAGGTGAGYGAHYGEKNYGPTGEMIGGLGGGLFGTYTATMPLYSVGKRYLQRSIFPFTPAGAKAKAANRLRTLAETINIEKTVAKEQSKVLKGAKISPAKLSGDRHMVALEKAVLKDDPVLAHQFDLEETAVNTMARQEVEDLGGNIPIEQTQAYISGRVEHTKKLIQNSVTKAVTKSQEILSKMSPTQRRKNVNQIAGKHIDDALTKARAAENEAWGDVDKKVMTTLDEVRTVYSKQLDDLPSTADKDLIPNYLRGFLGDIKEGEFVEGTLKASESVKNLHGLRSRITTEIRELKAAEAPNWNKIRILNDVQEAILKDLEKTPTADNLTKAIALSRELNEKFSGGVMNTIMGNEKTGGKLASELTLEGIKNGPKAAVEINRVLAAAPKSQDVVEEYVKMQIAQSNVVREGRINLLPAKKYMVNNEDVLDIFPDLKRAMNNAIAAEEKAKWLTDTAKQRLLKVNRSLPGRLAVVKPKTFLKTVMESPNPEIEMKTLVGRLNRVGKEGVKNDIVDYLLNKSKTTGFDENVSPILSGRKFFNELKNNRRIFHTIMKDEGMDRLDIIANTLIKNEDMTNLPDVGSVIEATRNPLSWAIEILAVRAGAKMGHGTSGASLKTAGMFGEISRKLLGDLDTGRARQLIKDAIQDPELFKELATDITSLDQADRFMKVYHGWLMADAVRNIDENN